MKKLHKKSNQPGRNQEKNHGKVKRSDKATGVHESAKAIFTKRSPFTNKIGTDIPDPNKENR